MSLLKDVVATPTPPMCPFCGRDLEDLVELGTGMCTSDDCPRHEYQSPCSYNHDSGLLTLETGETIHLPSIQEALTLTFVADGNNDLAFHASELSKLTCKTLGPNLEWEDVE